MKDGGIVRDGSHIKTDATIKSVDGSTVNNNKVIYIIIAVFVGVFFILPLCGSMLSFAAFYYYGSQFSDTEVIGDLEGNEPMNKNIYPPIETDEPDSSNGIYEIDDPETVYISETLNCVNGYGTEYTLNVEYPDFVEVVESIVSDECLISFRYLDGVLSINPDYGESYTGQLANDYVIVKEDVTHVSFGNISGDLIRIKNGPKAFTYATLFDGACSTYDEFDIEPPCGHYVHTLLPGLRGASIVIIPSTPDEDTENILRVFDDISSRFSGSDFER